MSIEGERVAFVVVLWAAALGFIGFAAGWSAATFAAAYAALGLAGFLLLRWRRRAERSAPLDPQIGLAVAAGVQVALLGVHAFLGGEGSGLATTALWVGCAALVGLVAAGLFRALRRRARLRRAAGDAPAPIAQSATPLAAAFALARATGDIGVVLPVFLRARLFVVGTRAGDRLDLAIAPSPHPERFCVTVAERAEALGSVPPHLVHAVDARTLLARMVGAWDILVVHGDGEDVLYAEFVPDLRRMAGRRGGAGALSWGGPTPPSWPPS